MPDQALKPCPFCRSANVEIKGVMKKCVHRKSRTFTVSTYCNTCGAKGSDITVECKYISTSYDAIIKCYEEAVKQWNERVA